MVGPIIVTPMPNIIGLKAPNFAISWVRTRAWATDRPPPPYSAGQVGVAQPLRPIALRQALSSALDVEISADARAPLPFRAGGKLASIQARASARKSSSSTSAPKSAMSVPPGNIRRHVSLGADG